MRYLTTIFLGISILFPGKSSAWIQTSSLVTSGIDRFVLSSNNYLYAFGQSYNNTYQYQYAPITTNGSLGIWKISTSTGITNAAGKAGAISGLSLYISGGWTGGTNVSNQVQMAQVTGNGTLSQFSTVLAMINPRAEFGIVANNGYLYAMGGYNYTGPFGQQIYLHSVEYSKISSNGLLYGWQTTTSMNSVDNIIGGGVWVANGYIWVLGENGNLEKAFINANGSLGIWQLVSSPFSTRPDNLTNALDGFVYGFSGMSTAQRAEPHSSGTFSTFQTLELFNKSRYSVPAAYQYYVYSVGGNWWAGDTSLTVEYRPADGASAPLYPDLP